MNGIGDGIRVEPSDLSHVEGLSRVVEETGLFPTEMLPGMISGFVAGNPAELWLTCLAGGTPAGLCFARAEELADGAWNMLALAVLPGLQGRGIGTALVSALERKLTDAGARILIVDTSSTPHFAGARSFYGKAGYEQEARIRDYWAEGDDKITFRKRLRSRGA